MRDFLPAEMLDKVFDFVFDADDEGCNFALARRVAKTTSRDYANRYFLAAFGQFGLDLVALDQPAALKYSSTVLAITTCNEKVFVLRLKRWSPPLEALVIECLEDEYSVVLCADAPKMANPASRLTVTMTPAGEYASICAVGRLRYKVIGDSVVAAGTVTPRKRGRSLRVLPHLGTDEFCPHTQNFGKNCFARTFPRGHAGNPYFVFAQDKKTNMFYKQAVHATTTIVSIDTTNMWATGAFETYAQTGKLVPKLMWECQAHSWKLKSVSRRTRLLTWLCNDKKRCWGTTSRVIAGARVYNFVFMKIGKAQATTDCVVCLPPNAMFLNIREVLAYDDSHVMLVCNFFVSPNREPHTTVVKPVTVLCGFKPLPAALSLDAVENICVTARSGQLEESLRTMLEKFKIRPAPLLTIPGHFSTHVATATATATVFGRALLYVPKVKS